MRLEEFSGLKVRDQTSQSVNARNWHPIDPSPISRPARFVYTRPATPLSSTTICIYRTATRFVHNSKPRYTSDTGLFRSPRTSRYQKFRFVYKHPKPTLPSTNICIYRTANPLSSIKAAGSVTQSGCTRPKRPKIPLRYHAGLTSSKS